MGLQLGNSTTTVRLAPAYYRWQSRLFDMVKAQQEVQFADVTPEQPSSVGGFAVTVRIAGAWIFIRVQI